MARLFDALRSALYASVFLGGWGWLALQVRPFDGSLGLALPAWLTPIGGMSMALGGALALACVAAFVMRGRGTPAPFDPPTRFVVSGPYRWVRNPMYIGGLAMLVGFGLWHRSPSMLIFAGLPLLLVHAFVLVYEEPQLEARFGEPYRAYKEAVNRWVPRAARRPAESEGG